MTSMHSARWTKLGATTSHVSACKMMSAWTTCRPRGVFIFHALPDRPGENSVVYLVPAHVRSAPESRQIADVSVSPYHNATWPTASYSIASSARRAASYVEWLTCLEMERDVPKMERRQPQFGGVPWRCRK